MWSYPGGKIFLSQLFSVPKMDSGKMRLVMDLSILNKFLKPRHFKKVTADQDFQDTNWHVPIHTRFYLFLVFQVGEEMLQFTILPFSLTLAPRVFTQQLDWLSIR